jgi:hypothetical protein
MDSGAVIYTPSFIKIGPGVQNLIVGGGGYTPTEKHTHIKQQAPISLLYYF